MRRFATAVANASTVLGRATRAGARYLWREKSPQTFSDSPVGSFSHATYGSRGQHCAVPRQAERSIAVARGLDELQAAGVGAVKVWELTVTQADQFLSNRTPYVRAKLDCTHLCEPSGVLDAWSIAALEVLSTLRPLGLSGL